MPEVWDVLGVVLAGEVVGVVDRAVVVVVDVVEVVDVESDGLLEQAASARAQAGRLNNNSRTDHGRRVLGIAPAYDGVRVTRGFFQDRYVEPGAAPPSGA